MSGYDTIAAIATAPGQAAVGLIRMSGPQALAIASALFHSVRRIPFERLETRVVYLGEICEPQTGDPVDQVLLTLFRAPHSYTGEDMVEISAHGGPVPMQRILALVFSQGARLAAPGEFTSRAFLNGKMDLAQAEAVMDIVAARTDRALGIALQQLEGRLSRLVRSARQAVLPLLAHIEANLDFPEDVPEMEPEEVRRALQNARETVSHLLETARAGRVTREGARVVLVGRPNVGKSSLLNALLREDRAIVTAIPGTTRDVIEETANVCGVPVCLIDTAGVREAEDLIERMGVERTLAQAQSADLLLAVLDSSAEWQDGDRDVLRLARGRPAIAVANKSDLPQRLDLEAAPEPLPDTVVRVSATEGTGLDALQAALARALLGTTETAEKWAVVSNARHQAALERARTALDQAWETVELGLPLDLVASDLQRALHALGEITGESVSEAVLTEVFDRFCIGK